VTVPTIPFEDMTLPEVIRAVLTRPMTQTELVVTMLAQGYETTMTRNALRDAVGMELRKGAVKGDGGKWTWG